MSRPHEASASMAGYLYQVRYALLRALEEGRRNPGRILLIEQFDDVAFEEDGRAIELIQTKHHGRQADVSDASVDLWKTLGIWMERLSEDPAGAANTRFIFVTTNTAQDGSALSMLRQSSGLRDEAKALASLVSAAKTYRNRDTAKARAFFLALSDTEREILIGNIWVFDQAPHIVDVREDIEEVLHYSAPADQLGDFTDQLEGWWFSRVIGALAGNATAEIPVVVIKTKVTELRERFKVGNLMIDEQIEVMSADTGVAGEERTFVRQMRMIEVSEREVSATIYDYYRAYEQRSRWARESLLLDGEADRYERSLFDAWERRFFAKTADVNEDTEEAQKRVVGRDVFRWSREHPKAFRNRDELWLSSGSFQMLADGERIGWHPEYEERLGGSKVEE